MKPDLSVIIPTHNRARFIAAALDSVIAQTAVRDGLRVEVAIVDDGSTDATDRVVAPYLEKYGATAASSAASSDVPVTITYTRLEKQGVVVARNTAIAQTTAPLVAFLDSDDLWMPEKIERQLAALRSEPDAGVAHTAFRYIDENSQFVDNSVQRPRNVCMGRCVRALLDEDLVIFSSAVARRDLIERIAREETHGLPFDPRWTNAQDYDLLLRLARHAAFVYVPEAMTHYRTHGAHGAMGNLPKAYGFHCRVQIDFIERHGASLGITVAEARDAARRFLFGRAEAAFWRRELTTCLKLCDVARELTIDDEKFSALRARASRPAWLYRVKDGLDRLTGRRG